MELSLRTGLAPFKIGVLTKLLAMESEEMLAGITVVEGVGLLRGGPIRTLVSFPGVFEGEGNRPRSGEAAISDLFFCKSGFMVVRSFRIP
jgi:hypothetical protein